jgi:transcriptional regulator with XRE-family HTH domain
VDSFPEVLKKARKDAGMSIRQLKSRMEEAGVPVSITNISFIENGKVKPTYSFVCDAAEATGIDLEQALRAAFLFRLKWSVGKEIAEILAIAEKRKLSEDQIKRVTATKASDLNSWSWS